MSCVWRTSAAAELPAFTLTFALLAASYSTQALRGLTEASAIYTLIRQRPLTPSCGGQSPYRGENSGPGRRIKESLTPIPELENPQPGADSRQFVHQGLAEHLKSPIRWAKGYVIPPSAPSVHTIAGQSHWFVSPIWVMTSERTRINLIIETRCT